MGVLKVHCDDLHFLKKLAEDERAKALDAGKKWQESNCNPRGVHALGLTDYRKGLKEIRESKHKEYKVYVPGENRATWPESWDHVIKVEPNPQYPVRSADTHKAVVRKIKNKLRNDAASAKRKGNRRGRRG